MSPIDDNIIEPVIVPIPGIVFILESILLYSSSMIFLFSLVAYSVIPVFQCLYLCRI